MLLMPDLLPPNWHGVIHTHSNFLFIPYIDVGSFVLVFKVYFYNLGCGGGHVHMHACIYLCKYPQRPEVLDSPGAGVSGYALPDVSAGN